MTLVKTTGVDETVVYEQVGEVCVEYPPPPTEPPPTNGEDGPPPPNQPPPQGGYDNTYFPGTLYEVSTGRRILMVSIGEGIPQGDGTCLIVTRIYYLDGGVETTVGTGSCRSARTLSYGS